MKRWYQTQQLKRGLSQALKDRSHGHSLWSGGWKQKFMWLWPRSWPPQSGPCGSESTLDVECLESPGNWSPLLPPGLRLPAQTLSPPPTQCSLFIFFAPPLSPIPGHSFPPLPPRLFWPLSPRISLPRTKGSRM